MEFSNMSGSGGGAPAGTPSNPSATEVGYIVGLSSNAQDQLDDLDGRLDVLEASSPAGLADDTYVGRTWNGTAGAALAQWDWVYLGSDSKWEKATADAAASKARGVVVAAANENAACIVLYDGAFRDDGGTALTAGSDFYLSATAGALSASAPAAGKQLQVLGFALTSKIRIVQPSPDCGTIA